MADQEQEVDQTMRDQGINPAEVDAETKDQLNMHMHGAEGDDGEPLGDSIPRPSEDGDADTDADESDAGADHDTN